MGEKTIKKLFSFRCLRFLKESKLKNGMQTIVFPSKAGTYVSPDNLRRSLRAVCINAKLEYFGMHVSRHTYATRLIDSGVPVKTVSELLGHSKVEVTLNTYVIVSNDVKHTAIESLNKLIQST